MKNKRLGILLMIIAALSGAFILLYLFMDVKLIGDKEHELCIYDEYFENGCRGKLLGFDLNNISISDNIDNREFGDYSVDYEISFLFLRKRITRNVHVIDNKKPTIKLKGNDTYFLSLDDEYLELGYSAYDNYDLDITDKVIVSGNIDTSKVGDYLIAYEAFDSSGNKAVVNRKVIVRENNYLACSVSEFWLADIFPEIIIEPQAAAVDYFDEVVLIGDSNTWFLYKWSSLINADQCWGKRNLNMTEINSSVFDNFVDGKQRTLDESIDEFKPKYLIISPGIGSPLFMNNTDKYVEELKKCIDYLRNEHPEITFAFVAILPINDGQLSKEFQKRINIYNYYLAEVCYNYDVKLINFSDTIRGEDGYGLPYKFVYSETNEEDRGFHLSTATRADYVDYLKHCDIKGD